MSGNNVWTSGSLNDKDVTFVTSFTDLQAALKNAAESLCGRELKVTKQVDENGDGVFNDSSTTPFTIKATVTVTGGSTNPVRWIDPNDAAAASPSTKPKTIVGSRYGIVPVGICLPRPPRRPSLPSKIQSRPGTRKSAPTVPPRRAPQQSPRVKRWTCTIKNRRKGGKIQLKKVWLGTPGDVALSVTNANGGATLASGTANGANGETLKVFVPTGGANVAVNLNESFTSGSQSQYTSAVACTGTNTGAALPSGAYAAGTPAVVQIDDGDDIVCEITNTRKKVDLTLKKVWVGAEVPITIGIDGNPTGERFRADCEVGRCRDIAWCVGGLRHAC